MTVVDDRFQLTVRTTLPVFCSVSGPARLVYLLEQKVGDE